MVEQIVSAKNITQSRFAEYLQDNLKINNLKIKYKCNISGRDGSAENETYLQLLACYHINVGRNLYGYKCR